VGNAGGRATSKPANKKTELPISTVKKFSFASSNNLTAANKPSTLPSSSTVDQIGTTKKYITELPPKPSLPPQSTAKTTTVKPTLPRTTPRPTKSVSAETAGNVPKPALVAVATKDLTPATKSAPDTEIYTNTTTTTTRRTPAYIVTEPKLSAVKNETLTSTTKLKTTATPRRKQMRKRPMTGQPMQNTAASSAPSP
jgi:hypothetical protein